MGDMREHMMGYWRVSGVVHSGKNTRLEYPGKGADAEELVAMIRM
jgi:hypothetical protein